MVRSTRRAFLSGIATGGAALATTCLSMEPSARAAERKRKFTMDLTCGMIGVQASLRDSIRLAREHGFESVAPSNELVRMSDTQRQEISAELMEKKLVWGVAGLSVDFRGNESVFQNGMKELPALAAGLQRAGVRRVGTWLSPGHSTLTYLANFKQHRDRLRQVAKSLNDHGLRFGMEYVGPKTSWSRSRYPFIHTMAEIKELIADIGCDNVGIALDSWHWYTAHETKDDLLTLTKDQVVDCHLNDAPANVAVDDQVDGRRELPAATGVIDLKSFLGALVEIGYDGPVRAEPFNQQLRALPKEQALATTATAMRKAFALVEG